VLGDGKQVLLVEESGAKWKLSLTGDARAIDNLLGCRVTLKGTTVARKIQVHEWSVEDSGYGSQPHVGQLKRVGGAWRMLDRNSGALLELLGESLGGLVGHDGDLVLVDGLVVGPHLIQVVSYRILIDLDAR
jgi:hypothetical protein